jgi:hypothetical protein
MEAIQFYSLVMDQIILEWIELGPEILAGIRWIFLFP